MIESISAIILATHDMPRPLAKQNALKLNQADAREPEAWRDTDRTLEVPGKCKSLIMLALPRGLEPLFSP